jgi:large subunit ribosomal protein L28
MSRSCELTGVKAQVGRSVPVNRSQTGVRTKRRFAPNIQNVSLISDALGKLSLRLAVKTIRSIEHNGGLDQFLLTTSSGKLSEKGKNLKKQVSAKNENKAPTEKPIRRQDTKSPKSLASASKRKAAGIADRPKGKTAKPAAAKKAPAKKPSVKKEA